MKRFLLIPLMVILASALILSGCAQEEETTTPPTTPPPTLSAIAVTPALPADLNVDSTQQFTATGTYSDGSTAVLFAVTWNSDDTSVATIDSNGLATGVLAGTTNITATQSGITSSPVSLTVVGEAPQAAPMTPLQVITTIPATPSVFVSVSVDSELLIAANPVTITEDMTLEDVIKAAHEAYYSGGLDGCDIGPNPAVFNFYMVNKCWGVAQIPFIIVNDHPNSEKAFEAVNTVKVAANDNIILCTATDPAAKPATPVSVKATRSGDSVTLTVTSWIMNPANYTYTTAPLANAVVWDPATGIILGKTDANGQITVTVPESGIVAIEGLAAINVIASATVE